MQILHRLKRPAAVLAVLILAMLAWGYVRAPLGRLWTMLGGASISGQRSSVKFTPPLACTGIGPDGAPMGVASSFSEDQVRATGVGVFLTYSGADPAKDTFKVRMNIAGSLREFDNQKFERKADILFVKFGNLPVGDHKVDFLVEGTVQQTASFEILPGTARAAPRSSAPRGRGQPPPTQEKPIPAPGQEAPSPPPRPAAAAQPIQTADLSEASVIPPPSEMVYQARHWHTITGSCTGELTLTPEKIQFSSEAHTHDFLIADAPLENNGLKERDGKSWNFRIEGVDVAQLLQRWQRGELFASASGEAATSAASIAQRLSGKNPPAPLVFEATRHKHGLLQGSCSGVLTLRPERITFASQEHKFDIPVDEAQIEGDGVQGRDGTLYKLEVPGEDAASILRAWKRGRLFQEKKAPGTAP